LRFHAPFGCFSALSDADFRRTARLLRDAAQVVADVREAIGWDVDLAVERGPDAPCPRPGRHAGRSRDGGVWRDAGEHGGERIRDGRGCHDAGAPGS
jgi:hypothetical protein